MGGCGCAGRGNSIRGVFGLAVDEARVAASSEKTKYHYWDQLQMMEAVYEQIHRGYYNEKFIRTVTTKIINEIGNDPRNSAVLPLLEEVINKLDNPPVNESEVERRVIACINGFASVGI